MTLHALRYYEGEEGEALMVEILSSTKHWSLFHPPLLSLWGLGPSPTL